MQHAYHKYQRVTTLGLCLEQVSRDPVVILERMMEQPFCHMHGPEHHIMVGAALLTAYKNAGGAIELQPALAAQVSAQISNVLEKGVRLQEQTMNEPSI